MAKNTKPNILVIWGDDIGWQNVSAYGMGTMGHTTPNIDRTGYEGNRFAEQYAQNSCTAGRAALPAHAIVGKVLESFKEFPLRAKAASFTVGTPWTRSRSVPHQPVLVS